MHVDTRSVAVFRYAAVVGRRTFHQDMVVGDDRGAEGIAVLRHVGPDPALQVVLVGREIVLEEVYPVVVPYRTHLIVPVDGDIVEPGGRGVGCGGAGNRHVQVAGIQYSQGDLDPVISGKEMADVELTENVLLGVVVQQPVVFFPKTGATGDIDVTDQHLVEDAVSGREIAVHRVPDDAARQLGYLLDRNIGVLGFVAVRRVSSQIDDGRDDHFVLAEQRLI